MFVFQMIGAIGVVLFLAALMSGNRSITSR
jgi:hypothetical protein